MSALERAWEDVLDEPAENIREEVQAANMLRALANPHRLKILKLLNHTPHNVMDLCERLGLRQSLASSISPGFASTGLLQRSAKGTTWSTLCRMPVRGRSSLFWMAERQAR